MPHSEGAETPVLASFQGPFGFGFYFNKNNRTTQYLLLDILYLDKYLER